MKKLKKTGLDLCHVTSVTLLTSQIRAGPVKNWMKDEHKHDEHEDIEKKVDIFTFWMVF